MKRRSLLLALLSLLLFGVPGFAAPTEIQRPSQLDLTILHTNDVHGHLLPFPYTEVGRGGKEEPSRGGSARRSTLVGRIRSLTHHPVFLLDSGDIATRGPFATTYEGLADTESMNAAGYELAAIGNNEFKLLDGVDQYNFADAESALLQVVKRSRFPWICANALDEKGDPLPGVQPYVVREMAGVRVGFLGLTAPRSAGYPQTKGWTISDPIEAAREWIPRVREHCDVLIAVTHIGTPADITLAARTRGIDAIIGGDSHTFLYTAIEVENLDHVKVPIVQTGEFGVNLGRFDLHFERGDAGSYKLARYHYELMPIDPRLKDDPVVAAAITPYVRPFMQVVGHIPAPGDSAEARTRVTTDLVVWAMKQATGDDVALTPLGGGFFETLRHQAVTRYDVYATLPFHDDVVTASLTGAEIVKLFRPGHDLVIPDVASLDPAKTYTVAMIDFEAGGEYHLAGDRSKETGLDIRAVMIQYLQHLPASARPGPFASPRLVIGQIPTPA